MLLIAVKITSIIILSDSFSHLSAHWPDLAGFQSQFLAFNNPETLDMSLTLCEPQFSSFVKWVSPKGFSPVSDSEKQLNRWSDILPYCLPLTLQDSRATFLAANLYSPASDPPRLLSTFKMKFLNMASKFFPNLTPSTLQPPLSSLSLPCLLPKQFPLPGCQTLRHEGSCLVTAWPVYSLVLLPGSPSLCPLSHINVYCFSGLSLNVTARKPSLTFPCPLVGPVYSSSHLTQHRTCLSPCSSHRILLVSVMQ